MRFFSDIRGSDKGRPRGLNLIFTLCAYFMMNAMRSRSQHEQVRAYYQVLFRAWGRQQWWPARTRFEVIVGAYLTQNTAWTNVEIALRSMRVAGVLNLKGVRSIPLSQLESLIRSSGYFRQKARRLKTFVAFLDAYYGGSLNRMFAQPTEKLREELLGLNGMGPETADSILLYAGQHPVVVVDAYTRRILDRHGPESVAFLSTGQIPTEEMALLGALAKFGMGMVHGDGNTRQCMATSVVA